MTNSSLITVSSYDKPIPAAIVAATNVGSMSTPIGSKATSNAKKAPTQTSQKARLQGDATSPTAKDVTQDSSDQGASKMRSRPAAAALLNPAAASFKPQHTSFLGNDQSFRYMVNMMNLPHPTLMTFDGVPLSYHMFIRSFG